MTSLDTRPLSWPAEFKAFLNLAMPLASAQVAQLATVFADTVMMGHLGPDALAAGALAGITFFSIFVMASGVVLGVGPLVAEADGAGQIQRVGEMTRQGVWLALLVTLPIMVAIAHLGPLMRHLGQSPTAVALAETYLNVILWGLFPAVGFMVLRGTLSALGHARPIFSIVAVGTGFNILANWGLGFGELGLPRLELAGLALGTTLALWGMFGALVVYLWLDPAVRPYGILIGSYRVQPTVWIALLRLGMPMCVFATLEIGVYTVVGFLIGLWGTESLAAYQIVFQTLNLIYMVPLGMSYAASARVGQWLGQRHGPGIRLAGQVSLGAGVVWCAGVAIAMLMFPEPVIGLYIDRSIPENAAIVTLAAVLMRMGAVAHFFDGVQKVAYGALQGLQDAQVPMVVSFLCYWCVGLASGCWLAFRWQWGTVGLFGGLLVAVVILAFLFIWRLQVLTRRGMLEGDPRD